MLAVAPNGWCILALAVLFPRCNAIGRCLKKCWLPAFACATALQLYYRLPAVYCLIIRFFSANEHRFFRPGRTRRLRLTGWFER